MTLERTLTVILFLATFIAGGVFLTQENLKYQFIEDETRRKPYVKMEDVFKEPLTLWWGGLTGQYPKYIGKKGMKGLGWEEYPVYSLKQELQDKYGVKIIDWMMSPSRLEFEFQTNRHPVCIYPYKWKDPEREFQKPKTYLLSYGVDFSGEERYGILIRKEDMKRFADFYNDKGDLNLLSIMGSNVFKTALIKGEEYSNSIKGTYQVLSDGSWKVNPKFEKNIYLMIPSENAQLLKMLKAGRIDFVLDKLVTNSHYLSSNIKKNEFRTLVYEQKRVESLDDPNLVRHSVRCNRHPLNFQMMPTINKFALSRQKSWGYKAIWNSYRRKFDPDLHNQTSLIQKFISSISKARGWYEKYGLADGFLEPLPIVAEEKKSKGSSPNLRKAGPVPLKMNSPAVKFKEFHDNEHLIIMDYGLWKDSVRPGLSMAVRQVTSDLATKLHEHLTGEIVSILRSHNPNMKTNSEILQSNYKTFQKLTIIGPSLPVNTLAIILKQMMPLKELHVLLPQSGVEKIVFEHLKESLSKLTLMGLNFVDGTWPLGEKLMSSKLDHLDLSFSMMLPNEIGRILQYQNTFLETLILDNLQIFDSTSKVFKDRLWPQLRHISLSARNTYLDRVLNSLGPEIRTLDLGQSLLEPNHLQHIGKKFPNLQKLKCSIPEFNGIQTLPLSLEELELVFAKGSFSHAQVKSIQFPKHLKSLGINARLESGDLSYLNRFLGETLESLELNGYADPNEISSFLMEAKFTNIKSLSINNMGINDDHLQMIANKYRLLEHLTLTNNLISDGSSRTFGQFENLTSLILGMNLLTDSGIQGIFKNKAIYEKLKKISLSGNLKVDLMQLKDHLPQQLEEIEIAGGYENDDVVEIFSKLPKTIRKISSSFYLNSIDAIYKFIPKLPPNLEFLTTLNMDDGSESYLDLLQALPRSLNLLDFNVEVMDRPSIKTFDFPPGLLYLSFEVYNHHSLAKNANIDQLHGEVIARNLPNGIRYLVTDYRGDRFINSAIKKILVAKNRFKTHIDSKNPLWLPARADAVNFLNGNFENLINAVNMNGALIFAQNFLGGPVTKKIKIKNFKDPRLIVVWMAGPGIDDVFAEDFISFNLSNLGFISLANTKLTSKGIIRILNGISKEVSIIGLSGSKLTLEGVDQVIAALPPRLHQLDISGSSFGQKGYQKFRDWVDLQQKKHGYRPALIE